MSNNVQRRLREKQELRLKIVDAARELFTVGGEEAVTLRAVAERIEYSATTIYSHFTDKQALLHELCAVDFQVFSRSLKQADRVVDPIERLRQISAAYVDFGLQYSGYYRLMFMPSAVVTSSSVPSATELPSPVNAAEGSTHPEINILKEGPYDFLYKAVFKAMAAGCFKPEYREVADISQLLWSGLHGVIALHLIRGRFPAVAWRPISAGKETMIECLLSGLTKQRPPVADLERW